MSYCKIFLENYNGTYYPGSEIKGRLECYFTKETRMRGIFIKLKCKEHNEWKKYGTRNKGKKGQHDTFMFGKNYLLHVQQKLRGSDYYNRTQILHRGKHVYPFCFMLSDDIPSTFSGRHGGITYNLKARIERPSLLKFDYKDELIFRVFSPVDFNKLPKELQAVSYYSNEEVYRFFHKGSIKMNLELSKKAFVVGETVNLRVKLFNMSDLNVTSIQVKIKRTIISKVTRPHRESKEDVEEILLIRKKIAGAREEHTFDIHLPIPEGTTIPNFTKCELFEVNYALKVYCVISGSMSDLTIAVRDIQLGHISWMDCGQNPPGPFPQIFLSNKADCTPTATYLSAPPSVYTEQPSTSSTSFGTDVPPPEPPPPSYEEAMRNYTS